MLFLESFLHNKEDTMRGYPPCIFWEVIAMKKISDFGGYMDRFKILSDYALHLSYRQALDAKKVEEVARGEVKQERMKPVQPIPQDIVLD
jgi:hypothetical protein